MISGWLATLMGFGVAVAQQAPAPTVPPPAPASAPAPAPATPPQGPLLRAVPPNPGFPLPPQPGAVPAIPVLTNGIGPKIQFATPIYDFGKVKSGELVKYSYVFTNTGDRTLEITQVQPGCGCTTAGEWTKKVETNQTGQVPIQFNSANFNGQVLKTVTVRCNDPAQANGVVLQLKGTIWRPIDYIPQYAVLNLPPDVQTASTVVKIVNNTEEPITLSPPEVNNRSFTATLATNNPGKEYQITVNTVPPLPAGTVQAMITVKTSSTNMAVLNIPLWVNVQPAVMVMPPQISLLPPPLQTKTTPAITIQNNSTNSLVLSDPAINIPGVEVQLNTMQTGRVYSATLTFPQGFEIPAGRPVEFTVKSSLAQMPLIKVPVMQIPRPLTPPLAPAPPPTPAAVPAAHSPTNGLHGVSVLGPARGALAPLATQAAKPN
jgi:hypothetical protein